MRPVTLLVAFCATMAAIAVARLQIDDEQDPVDIGVTLIVLGSTLLALLWIAIDESWSTLTGQFVLAGAGSLLVAAGTVLLVRYVNPAAESPS